MVAKRPSAILSRAGSPAARQKTSQKQDRHERTYRDKWIITCKVNYLFDELRQGLLALQYQMHSYDEVVDGALTLLMLLRSHPAA